MVSSYNFQKEREHTWEGLVIRMSLHQNHSPANAERGCIDGPESPNTDVDCFKMEQVHNDIFPMIQKRQFMTSDE